MFGYPEEGVLYNDPGSGEDDNAFRAHESGSEENYDRYREYETTESERGEGGNAFSFREYETESERAEDVNADADSQDDFEAQNFEVAHHSAFPVDVLEPFSFPAEIMKQARKSMLDTGAVEAAIAEANAAVAEAAMGRDRNDTATSEMAMTKTMTIRTVTATFTDNAEDLAKHESSDYAKYDSRLSMKSMDSRSSVMTGASFSLKRERSEQSSQEITRQTICSSALLRRDAAELAKLALDLNTRHDDNISCIGKDVQFKLENRIEGTGRFVSTLASRTDALEPVTYLLEQCINDLEHTHKNYWPALSVAIQRQKIRESCPTGELDKDYLQQALQWEQSMVGKGRIKINKMKAAGLDLLKRLDANFQEMRICLQQKRFHMTHDKSVMKVSHEKGSVSLQLLKEEKRTESNRPAWSTATVELLKTSVLLEKEANLFRADTDELIKQLRIKADMAAKRTQALFEKHSAEMIRLRKLIEKEMNESHETMSTVGLIARDAKRELDKIQAPITSSDRKLQRVKTYSAKQQRTTLLDAAVSGNDKLHARFTALHNQHDSASSILQELEHAHQMLEDDYNVKTIAMKYTEKCLLATAQQENGSKTAKALQKINQHVARNEKSFASLTASTLADLRRRIRALASVGTGGKPDFDSLFERILKQTGAELSDHDVRVVLRKMLKIGPKIITDPQISSLCAMIDDDNSGGVNVHELREFMEAETTTRTVASFGILNASERSAAKKKHEADKIVKRPPLDTLPYLKPSQIALLKKRIRGAAWIAATNLGLDAGHGGELGALFSQFDKDGGGELEDEEMRRAFRVGLKLPKSQLSDPELWTLIHMIDTDGGGSIGIQEFVDWVKME